VKPDLPRKVYPHARNGRQSRLSTCTVPLKPAADMPDPLAIAEEARRDQSGALDRVRRSQLGQFFTPPSTARLMASTSSRRRERLRLLDAGAGVGALTAAWVSEICSRSVRPKEISLTCYELDEALLPALRQTLTACEQACAAVGIRCKWEVRATDFIESAVDMPCQLIRECNPRGSCCVIRNVTQQVVTSAPDREVQMAMLQKQIADLQKQIADHQKKQLAKAKQGNC